MLTISEGKQGEFVQHEEMKGESPPRLTAGGDHGDLTTPNRPHPSLKCPPLHIFLRLFPCTKPVIDFLYRFRWSVSYPLQRQIPFNGHFRKLGVYLTWGELLLVLPFLCYIQ